MLPTGWCIRLAKNKLLLREVALFGILGAMTFGAKVVMASLPNIEPVSLLVMVYAAVFGKKCLYPIYVYVMLEILLYGLGPWNIMYLYIWALLALFAWLLRKATHPLWWAVLSGSFGLAFGALCAPVDVAMGGFGYAYSKWVSGIPFDLTHCIGNFAIALLMFAPMRLLLEKLYRRMLL